MNDQQFNLLLASMSDIKASLAAVENKIDLVSVETGRQDIRITHLEVNKESRKNFLSTILVSMFGIIATSLVIPYFKASVGSSMPLHRERPPIHSEVLVASYYDDLSNLHRHKKA